MAGSGTQRGACPLEGELKLGGKEGKFQGKGSGGAVVQVELGKGGTTDLVEVNADVISCPFLNVQALLLSCSLILGDLW